MLKHPNFDPVAIELGPMAVHWYGLSYLIGFAGAWLLAQRRCNDKYGWTRDECTDFVFYGALGAIIGGRIGYVFIYGWERLVEDPMIIIRIWEGGLSFHGGFVGVLIGVFIFARQTGRSWLQVGDFVTPMICVPIFTVRLLGNFVNGELWGRVTDVPWGMVFPGAGDLPRHPSQIYEAGLEGLLMGIILWWFSSKPRPTGAVCGLFVVLYATFRFFVEFFRQPDAHIGFVAFEFLSMGQLLSFPLWIMGFSMLAWAYRNDPSKTYNRKP